jgi:hypothetical protein
MAATKIEAKASQGKVTSKSISCNAPKAPPTVLEGVPSSPMTGRRIGQGPKPKTTALNRMKKPSCVIFLSVSILKISFLMRDAVPKSVFPFSPNRWPPNFKLKD